MPPDPTRTSDIQKYLPGSEMIVIAAVFEMLLGLAALIGITLWVTAHQPAPSPFATLDSLGGTAGGAVAAVVIKGPHSEPAHAPAPASTVRVRTIPA